VTAAGGSAGRPESFEPGTLVDLFLGSNARRVRNDAVLRRAAGTWETISNRDVADRVRALALGLRALGYERGDRIAILAPTRYEWALADWAVIMAGLVGVPVYPVLPADQTGYILSDSRAKAVFAADAELLAKVAEAGVVGIDRAILFDASNDIDPGGLELRTLEEVERLGRETEAEMGGSYESFARETGPDDLATLIYTSGTTGTPKGVMLTHDNLHSNVLSASRLFPFSPDDRSLSILPLAHVFERMVGHYLMWHNGVSVAYSESLNTIVRDLGETKPTIMAGLPRVFEKVLERAVATAREAGGLKWKIFQWARAVGEQRVDRELAGEEVPAGLALRNALADRLVFSKLRERTGGRIRFFVSGSAPLNAAVAKFFLAARLPVLEGYGLTETSPALCFNPPEAVRLGTVGPPIPGTEIRIAEDGEILARGPQIMKGYYGLERATAEAIDADGWFHTGDIGELDEAGYLKITDRKKDLIITAYGKNIAPQPVEEAIKQSPLVSQAAMFGDGRKFPIVIIVPEIGTLREWTREHGIGDGTVDLLEDDAVVRYLEDEIMDRCAGFAHYETPRRVLLLADEFTVESGELTPSLKVKRRVVAQRYAERIDELYREAEEAARDADAPPAREST